MNNDGLNHLDCLELQGIHSLRQFVRRWYPSGAVTAMVCATHGAEPASRGDGRYEAMLARRDKHVRARVEEVRVHDAAGSALSPLIPTDVDRTRYAAAMAGLDADFLLGVSVPIYNTLEYPNTRRVGLRAVGF